MTENGFHFLGKRYLPAVLSVTLVVLLVGLSIFLYLRTRTVKIPSTISPPEEVIKPLVNQPGNPIQKYISSDNLGFTYEIEGSFPSGLSSREDGLLTGRFEIRGDTGKRQLKTMIGTLAGYGLLGIYEGSFSQKVVWDDVPLSELGGRIQAGEAVRIRIEVKFERQDGISDFARRTQETVDALAVEMNSGNAELQIPSDFTLVTNGVGIIR